MRSKAFVNCGSNNHNIEGSQHFSSAAVCKSRTE